MSAPVTRTCEACGETFTKSPKRTYKEFATRRFCSKRCQLDTARRVGHDPRAKCKSDRHELSGDNVRHWNGKRACKACAQERERARKGQTPRVRRAPSAPLPVVIPPAPPKVERPVWRPAGFAPVPNTRPRGVA